MHLLQDVCFPKKKEKGTERKRANLPGFEINLEQILMEEEEEDDDDGLMVTGNSKRVLVKFPLFDYLHSCLVGYSVVKI